MLRIIIADDHPIVRTGLRYICGLEPDMRVSAECKSADAARVCRTHKWDILIIGIGYPNLPGFEIISALRAERPDAAILVFSIYPEDQYAIRALKAGASGDLTKDSPPEEVIAVMRHIAGGVRYVRPDFAQKLVLEEMSGTRDTHRHEQLSTREFQVLIMIAAGKPLMQIAESLTLSVKTVSTFRSRILNKLRLKNTAELVVYSMQHGLIQVPESMSGIMP